MTDSVRVAGGRAAGVAAVPGPAPRASLAEVPLYVPKPPKALPGGVSHRLFLNENPYPPLPSVRQAIAAAALDANQYPDITPDRLVRRLAELHEVAPGRLVTGPGSVGIYQQVGQAFLAEGDEVVYSWPSFEAYPIVARVAGAVPVAVPAKDQRHDLDAMAAAVGPRTSAVFVCNPDNPTSTAFGEEELEDFLDRIPAHVLVVLDDAYHEFAGPGSGSSADAVAAARRRPNVLALRTFSKAYSLAGLRVGYGVAAEPVAQALRKCAVPCGVSGLAVAAALASLTAAEELHERIALVIAERERLTDGLAAQGWPTVRSRTNFVWLPLGAAAEGFAQELQAHGLLVRTLPGEGVRISVGTPEANGLLLETAGRIAPPRRDEETR
ncbi:MAG TPA: histidinol-phosphate transaminase [Actinospica sp.]|jgi:histidinol-phosphate aminotransferase|nr:histidinol-phosphate transaminase [Actinospica sp.]